MAERSEKSTKEVVIFAVVEEGHIILEKRLNFNKSYFNRTIVPGGKVEADETIEETLIREMVEEFGLIPKQWKYLTSLDVVTEKGNPYTHHIFLVTKTEGEFDGKKLQDNLIIKVPLGQAMDLCEHHFSKQILQIIETELLGD